MPQGILLTVRPREFVITCLVVCLSAYGTAIGQEQTAPLIWGTVFSETGQPVQNARVDISSAAPIHGPAIFCPSCYLDCQKWTTTDKAGRFEIDNLDSGLKFRLIASAVGHKTTQTQLIVPGESSCDLVLKERPDVVDPQRTITGVVKTNFGIPIQGALVESVNAIAEDGLRWFYSRGVAPAVTDSQGYFVIDLVEGVFGVDVEISAEGLSSRRFIGLKPNSDPQVYKLLEGAQVTGRVRSRGRPVRGMTVCVAQTDRTYRGEKFFQKAIPVTTDAEGRFEFKNLFPDQEYCVYTVVGEANRSGSTDIIKTQKFITPPNGKKLHIGDLITVDPISICGRLSCSQIDSFDDVDLSLKRDPAWDLIQVAVASDGTFCVDGLPAEVYELKVASSQFDLDADKMDSLLWTEKSIKRYIEESVDDLELPLKPTESGNQDSERKGMQALSGRLVHAEGASTAGIVVSANNGNSPKTNTLKDGRFSLEFPATTDWIKLYRPDPDGMRFWYLGRFKPKPGGSEVTIQLGKETTFQPDALPVVEDREAVESPGDQS